MYSYALCVMFRLSRSKQPLHFILESCLAQRQDYVSALVPPNVLLHLTIPTTIYADARMVNLDFAALRTWPRVEWS